jgi:hypothetical protein
MQNEKLPLKEGQLILLKMPEFNQAKKKATDWKPNWIAKIENGKAIIIPLSTKDNKPSWQLPFQPNGTKKNSWLQLDSGKLYTINKWGELNLQYFTLEQTPEATNKMLWEQCLKWSELNPWWILKDAD